MSLQDLLNQQVLKIDQTVEMNRSLRSVFPNRKKVGIAIKQSVIIGDIKKEIDRDYVSLTIHDALYAILESIPYGMNRLKMLETMAVAIAFQKFKYQDVCADYLGASKRSVNHKINTSPELMKLKTINFLGREKKMKLLKEISHEEGIENGKEDSKRI